MASNQVLSYVWEDFHLGPNQVLFSLEMRLSKPYKTLAYSPWCGIECVVVVHSSLGQAYKAWVGDVSPQYGIKQILKD